jgi:lactoylglutathione lyase
MLEAMSVRGLFETHLTVADLSRSVAFYRDVVGLRVALEVPERGAAFHWIGQAGQAMLGLWSIGSAPMGMQLHSAFDMALLDVLEAPERLRVHGIQPLSFFGEPANEPSVIGWMPAAAVYFRDPDGHLLEYLAMLEGPARPALGIVPRRSGASGARHKTLTLGATPSHLRHRFSLTRATMAASLAVHAGGVPSSPTPGPRGATGCAARLLITTALRAGSCIGTPEIYRIRCAPRRTFASAQ